MESFWTNCDSAMNLNVKENSQHDLVDTEKQLISNYESCSYKSKETLEETDFKGNSNLTNSVKTEPNVNHSQSPSSLFQDETCRKKFNDSSSKRAIDLSIHNRATDGRARTIFDDAEYFSKNYSYKLLPINFENVNETIIHSEHNYCHLSLSSESEAEDDCSRTMDYNQVKEKNYKKRKAKFKQKTSEEKFECDKYKEESNINQLLGSIKPNRPEPSNFRLNETECSLSAQPLDLSAPVVQDEKTDHYLREYSPSIVNTTSNTTIENEKDDSAQFDSDKENQKSNVKLIEVTITRADGKENYQPCDLFLNDIARLVPKLIGKDCKEIDILDRTCDHYVDFQKHRLYYVISESTWQLFQSANDRVILTNDRSLGQPVQNQGKDERPTYLVFDQFSLAKCLADYCKEIGGCFEYTFVEESKQEIVEPSEISIQNHNFENRKPVEECKAKIKRDPDATSPENLSEVSESYQGKSETKQEREEDITISSDGNACGNLININATLKKRQIKESTASDIKSCVFEQREDMEKEQKNHLEELISESSNRSKLVSTDNLNAECDECIKETVLKEVRENRTVEGEGKSTESSQMAVDAIENLGKCKKGGQVTRTKKGEMTANSQIPLETKLRRSQRSESNTEKRIPKNITRKSVANNLKSEKSNKPSYMKTRSKSTSEIVLQNRMRREKFVTSQNSDKSKEGSRRGTKRKHSPSEDLKKTTSGEISVLQSQVRRTTRSDKENQIKSNSKRLVESGHKKGEKKVKNSETIKKNLSSGKSKSSKRLLQMQKTKSENNSAKKKAKNNKMKFWKENSKKNEISKSGTKQEIKKGKKVLHKGKKYN